MNKLSSSVSKEPEDVMYRIKRGLCGYVSYLAACEMNQAFSEYVLYEPILRILTARNFSVQCEYICPGGQHASRGDKKRLDFYAIGNDCNLAIEVKWITDNRLTLISDVEKLRSVHRVEPNTYPLLVLFGPESKIKCIDKKVLEYGFREAGKIVVANLRKTKYACRVFLLKKS